MGYEKVALANRPARGRNGVFDAQVVEVFTSWQEPEHVPHVVIEVWSRRRAEGYAPIRFTLSIHEAYALAEALDSVASDAQRGRLRFLDKEEKHGTGDNLPPLRGDDPEQG